MQKLYFFWIVYIAPKVALQGTWEKRHQWSYLGLDPSWYSTELMASWEWWWHYCDGISCFLYRKHWIPGTVNMAKSPWLERSSSQLRCRYSCLKPQVNVDFRGQRSYFLQWIVINVRHTSGQSDKYKWFWVLSRWVIYINFLSSKSHRTWRTQGWKNLIPSGWGGELWCVHF